MQLAETLTHTCSDWDRTIINKMSNPKQYACTYDTRQPFIHPCLCPPCPWQLSEARPLYDYGFLFNMVQNMVAGQLLFIKQLKSIPYTGLFRCWCCLCSSDPNTVCSCLVIYRAWEALDGPLRHVRQGSHDQRGCWASTYISKLIC